MAKPKLSSLLVFGVDIGAQRLNAAAEPMARQLVQQFERRQIPLTWTTPDPTSDSVAWLRSWSLPQEIALAWDGPAVTTSAEAFAFAAELRTRINHARQTGVQIRSLAVDPRCSVPYHTLQRCGLSSLRPARVRASHQVTPARVESLRFGLWGIPVSCFWPHPNRIVQRYLQHQLLQQTRAAAQNGRVLHVVIDLQMLSAQADSAWTGLTRVLDLAAALRDQSSLQLCRLGDVERLARLETAAQPARSILRRAG